MMRGALSTLVIMASLSTLQSKKIRLEHQPRPDPPESHHAEPSHSRVVTLMNETALDELVSEHTYVAVLFYAPWCGHSQQLYPHWTEASVAMYESQMDVILAKADLTRSTTYGLRNRFGIRGFPSLKIFKGHSALPHEYRGPHETTGIVKFFGVDRSRCTQCAPAALPTTRALSLGFS
jgi:thioredoxin-like negative regulator of GroEL